MTREIANMWAEILNGTVVPNKDNVVQLCVRIEVGALPPPLNQHRILKTSKECFDEAFECRLAEVNWGPR